MITSHYYNADTWHDIKNRGFEQYLTTRGSTGWNMYASVEGTYWKESTMGWKDAEEDSGIYSAWIKWIAQVTL